MMQLQKAYRAMHGPVGFLSAEPLNVLQITAVHTFVCSTPPLLWCCCRWRSDSLTVIKTPQGIDSNKIVKHAYSRYNLSIGIGLSQVTRCCLL
jgi:hypothetical protein